MFHGIHLFACSTVAQHGGKSDALSDEDNASLDHGESISTQLGNRPRTQLHFGLGRVGCDWLKQLELDSSPLNPRKTQ